MPVFHLTNDLIFPNPDYAENEGILALGGDLSVERLLLAYSNGIFPWYVKDEPIMWWSPDPRCVLFTEKFKLSKSLRLLIQKGTFEVRIDTCFRKVIKNCADAIRKEGEGTWITAEMQKAYIKLHKAGYAHSIEIFLNHQLVGGLYGVSLGKAFFGESMFHHESNASKIAMYYLVQLAKKYKFDFIDNQMTTSHLMSLGAEEISRNTYLKMLNKSLKKRTLKGSWKNRL